MSFNLRDYQRAAVDSIYGHFNEHVSNPLVVVPTGGGKSPILATFIKEAIGFWPDTRILALVHVGELIEQSFSTLLRMWPGAPATIYSAGLGQKNLRGQIVFASIQSIYKRAFELQKVDLVIVDEAHMIPTEGDGQYRKLLAELLLINPYMKVVGFTATPFRLKSGLLIEGDNPIFGHECFNISIRELIEQGWLCPPVPKSMATRFDLTGVATRGGEFVPGQLARAVDIDDVNEAAVSEIMKYGADRKSWLAFCSGVQHAYHIRDCLRARGVVAETITGETPNGERAALIAGYKAGRIKALTNADVLTTGFDAPATDLLAVLRPTGSAGLWVQIIGRGTRLSPATGKVDCLVLDFGENTARFGPIDMIEPKSKQKGKGDAPVKTCPECESIVFAGLRECPDCGFVFPVSEKDKHGHTAADAPLLSTQVIPSSWAKVDDVRYSRHEKPGKPPSMKVDYYSGMARHSEWVCFEHEGYARNKAVDWWKRRSSEPVPGSVAEALGVCGNEAVKMPAEIATRPNGKFTEIVAVRF